MSSFTPLSASFWASIIRSSIRSETFFPRITGIAQKEQVRSQPSETFR